MNTTRIGAVVALVATLGACANSGYGPKESLGTLAGAALGGWAGSSIGSGTGQLAATAAGVLIGGLIGSQIGQGLDQSDQQSAFRVEQASLERNRDGEYGRWDNPNNGNYGYTVPQSTYQSSSGQFCRDYETTIVVNGRVETGTGTACRQSDGTWRVAG